MTKITKEEAKKRLEYLRGEIKAERISYGEIAELVSLQEYIDAGDVLLLEWAGVPEGQAGLPDEISISWCVADVQSIAKDLTDYECRQVLALAKHNHDATIGISWDTLQVWADEVRSNREE